jgi:hypothetical protein
MPYGPESHRGRNGRQPEDKTRMGLQGHREKIKKKGGSRRMPYRPKGLRGRNGGQPQVEPVWAINTIAGRDKPKGKPLNAVWAQRPSRTKRRLTVRQTCMGKMLSQEKSKKKKRKKETLQGRTGERAIAESKGHSEVKMSAAGQNDPANTPSRQINLAPPPAKLSRGSTMASLTLPKQPICKGGKGKTAQGNSIPRAGGSTPRCRRQRHLGKRIPAKLVARSAV